MPSRSNPKSPEQIRADYGFARVRDIAFDSIRSLWNRRRAEGMKQIDIAKAIGRDAAWVNRKLQGPGNWTLRTLGELAEGLNGEVEIVVHAIEDPLSATPNYHAYIGYEPKSGTTAETAIFYFDSPKGISRGTANQNQNTAFVSVL